MSRQPVGLRECVKCAKTPDHREGRSSCRREGGLAIPVFWPSSGSLLSWLLFQQTHSSAISSLRAWLPGRALAASEIIKAGQS